MPSVTPTSQPTVPFNLQATGPMSSSFAPAAQGFNAGYQNLLNALQLSGQTTSGQLSSLKTQLQQNQGQTQQSLINRGLGNTSVLNTMMQAPIRTYNQGRLDVQNAGALRGMQAYGNLANLAAQGGTQLSQFQQPYAQSQYAQSLQNAQNLQASLQAAFNQMNAGGNYGLSDTSGGGGSTPTQDFGGSFGTPGANFYTPYNSGGMPAIPGAQGQGVPPDQGMNDALLFALYGGA